MSKIQKVNNFQPLEHWDKLWNALIPARHIESVAEPQQCMFNQQN